MVFVSDDDDAIQSLAGCSAEASVAWTFSLDTVLVNTVQYSTVYITVLD